MSANYTTPGVYVREVPMLPPSAVEAPTAIPAFIGYTQKAPKIPVARVSTLLDYTALFGGPQLAKFTVTYTTNNDGTTSIVSVERQAEAPQFLLYYAVSHFFANGGGSCYISSAGLYAANTKSEPELEEAIKRLEQEDEPTLLVLTDAANLPTATAYYNLCNVALKQCRKLSDRFSILDVPGGPGKASVKAFRNGVTQDLSYGAAYTPYLQTSLSYAYEDEGVTVQTDPGAVFGQNALQVRYVARPPSAKIVAGAGPTPKAAFRVDHDVLTITVAPGVTGAEVLAAWEALADADPAKTAGFVLSASKGALISAGDYAVNSVIAEQAFKVGYKAPERSVEITSDGAGITFVASAVLLAIKLPAAGATGKEIVQAWKSWKSNGGNPFGFELATVGDGKGTVGAEQKKLDSTVTTLNTLQSTALYYAIKERLTEERVVLPPSAAVAGIYASVDRERGVWKAPANVSVASIVGPVTRITDEEQGPLNIDLEMGKSINAIRAFAGKGTVVWGARTLDGNSNEWRYIPVRRLFIMIEESTRKATSFAVFEPNVVTTWLKVKGMIESFLYSLWERGALAGSTPEQAYFVNVGLGKTMTTQDILEGRMIVDIGIAAARPAEFIVLRFTHKLQEA